jgi:hypothetical protein
MTLWMKAVNICNYRKYGSNDHTASRRKLPRYLPFTVTSTINIRQKLSRIDRSVDHQLSEL